MNRLDTVCFACKKRYGEHFGDECPGKAKTKFVPSRDGKERTSVIIHKTLSTWQIKGLVFKHESTSPGVVVCHNKGEHKDRTMTQDDLVDMLEAIRDVLDHIRANTTINPKKAEGL